MSISRDQDAPLDLNPDDWTGFDRRKDATKLRDAIGKVQAAKNQAIRDNKEGEIANLTKLLGLLRSSKRQVIQLIGKSRMSDVRRQCQAVLNLAAKEKEKIQRWEERNRRLEEGKQLAPTVDKITPQKTYNQARNSHICSKDIDPDLL